MRTEGSVWLQSGQSLIPSALNTQSHRNQKPSPADPFTAVQTGRLWWVVFATTNLPIISAFGVSQPCSWRHVQTLSNRSQLIHASAIRDSEMDGSQRHPTGVVFSNNKSMIIMLRERGGETLMCLIWIFIDPVFFLEGPIEIKRPWSPGQDDHTKSFTWI